MNALARRNLGDKFTEMVTPRRGKTYKIKIGDLLQEGKREEGKVFQGKT